MQVQEMFTQAEAGDMGAQFNLGMLYYEGRGVPQSLEKAVQWLQRAAASDHHEALNVLGVLHVTGRGVEQNYEKALASFRRADRCGYNCDPQDPDLAHDFRDRAFGREVLSTKRAFIKAMREASAEARYTVGEAYHGVAEDMESAKIARELFLSAATLGNGKAMYMLGVMCRDGVGVPASNVRAYMWFSLAEEQGNAKGRDCRNTLDTVLAEVDVKRASKLADRWRRNFPTEAATA